MAPAPRRGEATTTATVLDDSADDLRCRVAALERRVARLTALLRILFALIRVLHPDLSRLRVPCGCDKARIVRAIDRARGVVGLRRILGMIGLSASRLASWRRTALGCAISDRSSCPSTSPQSLTSEEMRAIREMVTAPEFRHVPTGRLALLAQRAGCVFASPSTWYRLVRKHGWRRPRLRLHPKGPEVGIRASKPDELWHIDTTVIRLVDGTRVYLHAIIDNFSRRILAWQLNERFEASTSANLLIAAGRGFEAGAPRPTLLADAGVENRNRFVDALIESGLLRRVLARIKISFSNSLVEAWWRSLKHQWLFLHPLDSAAKVRRLVEYYVGEHNSRLPHSAFGGQTPDELYFGTGDAVPKRLAAARRAARQDRLAANRAASCAVCA